MKKFFILFFIISLFFSTVAQAVVREREIVLKSLYSHTVVMKDNKGKFFEKIVPAGERYICRFDPATGKYRAEKLLSCGNKIHNEISFILHEEDVIVMKPQKTHEVICRLEFPPPQPLLQPQPQQPQPKRPSRFNGRWVRKPCVAVGYGIGFFQYLEEEEDPVAKGFIMGISTSPDGAIGGAISVLGGTSTGWTVGVGVGKRFPIYRFNFVEIDFGVGAGIGVNLSDDPRPFTTVGVSVNITFPNQDDDTEEPSWRWGIGFRKGGHKQSPQPQPPGVETR